MCFLLWISSGNRKLQNSFGSSHASESEPPKQPVQLPREEEPPAKPVRQPEQEPQVFVLKRRLFSSTITHHPFMKYFQSEY